MDKKKSRQQNLLRIFGAGFFLLALIFSPFRVVAQTPISLRSLEVDIWPEYDHPTALVIYHIVLPAELTLPLELKIHIPTAAGEPNAVAVREADGTLLSLAYTRTVNGDWSEITFTTTMPQVQVEYYDPSLVKNGSKRTFTYQWPGDYAVEAFTIQVQQPVGASDLKLTPNMGSPATGEDGLVYYNTDAGSLAAGQSFTLSLEYTKADNALTAESLKVQPSVPVGGVSASQRVLLNILPWALGGVGLLLIAGAVVWWYWQSGLGKSPRKASHRRRRLVIAPEESIPEGNIYCHHCGKRAVPGDRFCRACGTRLRV
jgi:hypothetical protein